MWAARRGHLVGPGLQKHTQSRTFPPVVLSVRLSVYWSVMPYSQLPATIWAEPLWPEQGLAWGMAAPGRLGASICSSHCRCVMSHPHTRGVTTVLLCSACGSGLPTGHGGEGLSLRHLGPGRVIPPQAPISEASPLTCLTGTRLPTWASAGLWLEGCLCPLSAWAPHSMVASGGGFPTWKVRAGEGRMPTHGEAPLPWMT